MVQVGLGEQDIPDGYVTDTPGGMFVMPSETGVLRVDVVDTVAEICTIAPPGTIEAEVGLNETEKSNGIPTVRAKVILPVLPSAPVPVTVIVLVPSGVDAPTEIVRVSPTPETVSATGFCDQVAVVPLGKPVTESFTDCGPPEIVKDVEPV
jgi:hypothetical protein